MNYDELEEIIVKSQEELDAIPADYKGKIYIEFGTLLNKAIIKNRYYRSVVARESSSVVAQGNTQVVDRLNANNWSKGKILISGNARKVHMPKTINEFMDFYGIKHTKTKATFYKAVRKYEDGTYHADYKHDFTYELGKIKTEKCDTNTKENCGYGIHVAYLNWALNFWKDWSDLAIIEVETKIEDIVMPEDTDGKVRTSKVKVIREVPLEECGAYGKILAKRRQVNGNN